MLQPTKEISRQLVDDSSRHTNEISSSRREGRFLLLIGVLFLFVISVQVLLRFEGPRRFLNPSIRLEGEALSISVQGLEEEAYPWLEWPPPDAESDPATWATVYLRFMGDRPREAWVIVNGRIARYLGPEGGTVTVESGDVIEVYCPGGEVSVVVSAATENLASPRLGTWVRGSASAYIGVVSLR